MIRTRITRREKNGLAASEHTEAVRFMRVVRMHEPRYPALRWLYHVPNGGWRHATVAAKLKSEGLRPGVHDYCWPMRTLTLNHDYPGLYIELKSLNGSPSKEQREFGEFVESQGYKVVYAKGWEAAWKAVCEYAGIPFAVI